MPSETHIVPVHVGDPQECKRLRITPSPLHSDELIDELAAALVEVWDQLRLPRLAVAPGVR